MASDPAPYSLYDDPGETAPLTEEEQAAVKRAEADVAAGRVYDHDEVARWLRHRAKEIVGRGNDGGAEDKCFTPLP